MLTAAARLTLESSFQYCTPHTNHRTLPYHRRRRPRFLQRAGLVLCWPLSRSPKRTTSTPIPSRSLTGSSRSRVPARRNQFGAHALLLGTRLRRIRRLCRLLLGCRRHHHRCLREKARWSSRQLRRGARRHWRANTTTAPQTVSGSLPRPRRHKSRSLEKCPFPLAGTLTTATPLAATARTVTAT